MRNVNGTGALALTAGLLAFPAAAPLALPAAAPLALPGSVAAQEQQEEEVATVTVEGEVLDLVTGIPVAVAIIGIPGIERTAISDEWGYFRLQEIPVGTYVVQVMRIGYETLVAEAPLNGEELLTVYLTPGPVSLEGIEIKVTDEDDLEWRASSALGQSVIGPLEMERLRERHMSLSDVLRVRHLPGSTYVPAVQAGCQGLPEAHPGEPVAADDAGESVLGGRRGRGAADRRGRRLDLRHESGGDLRDALPARSRRGAALRHRGRQRRAGHRDAGGAIGDQGIRRQSAGLTDTRLAKSR